MAHPSAATVVFMSDYGLADPFVGLCHAVITGTAPHAHVVDLAHAVRPQDVSQGAALLADSLPWLPPGAVVLAVVDPGVATERRCVIVAAGEGRSGRLFVGPDNGLLYPAAEALGGADAAWALSEAPGRATTFAGRDVFAPAAARLALGEPPDAIGERIEVSSLVTLRLPGARLDDGQVIAEVVHIDGFGNLQLSAGIDLLDQAALARRGPVLLKVGAAVRPGAICSAFADLAPGQIGVLSDAFDRLQVAVNRGSAMRLLGAAVGDEVVIGPPTPSARHR